jgi:putative Holliday junction resolvase
MARILALDYGKKRTGLAVTDPLQMIASGLTTVPSHELIPYLRKYLAAESVERIVIGEPRNLDGSATDATALADECARVLRKNFPEVEIVRFDERYTSRLAAKSIRDSGLGKKARQQKALLDEVSATILLQDYLRSF